MAKKAGTLDIEKLMAELNPEKTAKENTGEEEAASPAPVQKKSGFVTLIGRPLSLIHILFRTDAVPQEDLPYVGLLKSVLGSVDKMCIRDRKKGCC